MGTISRVDMLKKRKGMVPMLAEDMFEDKSIQVFCRATGNYLGLVRDGQQIGDQIVHTEIDESTGQVHIEVNPAQQSLF